MNTPEVLYQDHVKLYVDPEHFIHFESLLITNEIPYYHASIEKEFFGNEGRFYIQNRDRARVDTLIVDHDLMVSTETIANQFDKDRRMLMLFYRIVLVVAVISLIIGLVLHYS